MSDEEKKDRDGEKGFIAKEVEHYFKRFPHAQPIDIYGEVPISKNNFHRHIMAGREVNPRKWAAWRKALKASKLDFWKRAQKHFDD